MNDEVSSNLELTASIVSAYVANNSVPVNSLVDLVASVYASIEKLGRVPDAVVPVPAVPVKKSVTPDFIYSLEDGRKFKSLKRHLSSRYGMSPEQYRAKWNLPPDYPMVAPNYAEKRSSLARTMGLGRKGSEVDNVEVAAPPVAEAKPARRSRKKATEEKA